MARALEWLPVELFARIHGFLPDRDRKAVRLLSKGVVGVLRSAATTCVSASVDLPPLQLYPNLRVIKLLLTPRAMEQLFGCWAFAAFVTKEGKPAELQLTPGSARTLLDSNGTLVPTEGMTIRNVTGVSFKLRNAAETQQAVAIAEQAAGLLDATFTSLTPGLITIPSLCLPDVVRLAARKVSISHLDAPSLQDVALRSHMDLPATVTSLQITRVVVPCGAQQFPMSHNIQYLMLEGANHHPTTVQLFAMPNLRHLSLHQLQVEFHDPQQPLMECESLDNLDLLFCTFVGTTYAHIFRTWIAHPCLQKVDIMTYADDEEMFNVLESASSLPGSASAWFDSATWLAEITLTA